MAALTRRLALALAALLVVMSAATVSAAKSPAPALTDEQAAALTGVWVLEGRARLSGNTFDDLLVAAARNGSIDPQQLLEAAIEGTPGDTPKLVIAAVDPVTGLFVAYRELVAAENNANSANRIVGLAAADGTGPEAAITWEGVENESRWDKGVLQGDSMTVTVLKSGDTWNGTDLVKGAFLTKRLLRKDAAASVEDELMAIAQGLPLEPPRA